MVPLFTAEAALTPARSYRTATRALADARAVLPQQRVLDGRGGALEATPTVLTCPNCWTHDCGFLGLQTCLTCC